MKSSCSGNAQGTKSSACLPSCRYADIFISVCCACTFVGMGGLQTVFGQTLFDLASYFSVETATLAPMLTVRAAGYGFGTVAAGPSFDRFSKFSFWLLTLIISILCLSSSILPVSVHPAMLGVVIFTQGTSIGALNNGVHAILMRIWGKKSGPTMQLIHFGVALGAFLAPLIARPFLSEEGSSNSTNVSCTQLLDMYMYDSGSGQPLNVSSCLAMVVQNCSNASNLTSYVSIYAQVDCPMEPSRRYAWAYWILTLPLLIVLPAFPLYACRNQCFCEVADGADVMESGKSSQEGGGGGLKKLYPDTVPYKIFLFTLLTLLMFMYTGLEHTYGNFVFAYSVNSQLSFPKPRAALLASVFWGSFTFFRFFSIPLSLCGTPSSVMLIVNVGGGIVASTILLVWPVNFTAIWIGTAILGSSMASIYPNAMVWLSEHGPATGKTMGFLIVGATLGKMALPAVIGYLVTTSTPIALLYSIFAGMLLSAVILATLFVVANSWIKLSSGLARNKVEVLLYKMARLDKEEGRTLLTWESQEEEEEEEEEDKEEEE